MKKHSLVSLFIFLVIKCYSADVGITALISPVIGLNLTSTEIVTVSIYNFGTTAVSNFPLYYTLQGGPPMYGTYTGAAIPPGTNANFTFTQTANLAFYGNFTFNACTNLSLDQDTSNDCKSFIITHNLPNNTVTLYPQNIANWTGSCSSTGFLSNSLITWGWPNGSATEQVGWAKFDLTAIAGVDSVANARLEYYATDPWYFTYYYVRHLTVDPVGSTAANLYSHGTNDPIIMLVYGADSAPNAYSSNVLGASSDHDIFNAIPSGWYALAFDDYDGCCFWGSGDGWAQVNKPRLVLHAAVSLPHNVGVSNLILDPYANPTHYQPKCVLHNYGQFAESNIPVHITGPGGYDTTWIYTGSLAVGQAVNIVFNAHNFPPGTNMCFTACSMMTGDMSNFDDCATACMEFDAVLTQAYAYVLGGSLPVGPCKFYTQHPDFITSLAPTTTQPVSGGAWAHGQWYVNELISGTNTHGHLYLVDTTTGAMTIIGPLGAVIHAMAFDHTTNTMYGIGSTPASWPGNYITKIYTINLATGAATLLYNLGQVLGFPISLACNNAGMLFANDIMSQSIWAIDPTYFTIEWIGNTNLTMSGAQSASFDKSKDIYYHAGYFTTNLSILYSCIPGSGAMSYIGGFQGNSEITGFAIPFSYDVTPTLDIGAMWLDYPKSVCLTNQEAVGVKVRNYGNTSVHNFDICYKFMNNVPVCENWWNNLYFNLDPGMSMSYVFSNYINCSAPGNYQIKAWVNPTSPPWNLPDQNRINDTVYKVIHNTCCTSVNCYANALQEPEVCGNQQDDGCMQGGGFVNISNGQTWCGTTWKIDTLRDSDWYRFTLTSTKRVRIEPIQQTNMDIAIVKLPCSLDSLVFYKVFTACYTDNIVTGNLPPGDYAIVFTPDWAYYTTVCNTTYSFKFDLLPAVYCQPGSSSAGPYNTSIQNVTISQSGFNHASGWSPGGYSMNSYPTLCLAPGHTYTIGVTSGTTAPPYTYIKGWADWNQNYIFDVPSEEINFTPSPGNPASAVVTVPAGAIHGLTTIRLRVQDGAIPEPCGLSTNGEIEDYQVCISDTIHPAILKLPTLTHCTGTFDVPLTVTGFTSIYSFSFGFRLPAGFAYQSLSSIASALTPANLSVSLSGDTLKLSYYSSSAFTLAAGDTLCKISLTNALVANVNLNWCSTAPGTYVSSMSYGNLPLVFQDGHLTISGCSQLSGYVHYDNLAQSVIHDSLILILTPLNPPGSLLSTYVNFSGYYHFNNLVPGTYSLSSTTMKIPGGYNSTDAMRILQQFTGQSILSGIKLKAADVNNINSVNAADALLVLKRFTGMINSFPAGDWASEVFTLTINGTSNLSQNLKVLCYGDVNGSYTPLLKMAAMTRIGSNESLEATIGSTIDLPVSFTATDPGNPGFSDAFPSRPGAFAGNKPGSIGLVLEIPDGFKALELFPSAALEGEYFVYKIFDHEIRVAWCNPLGVEMKDGSKLFSIKGIINKTGIGDWNLGIESEIADVSGQAMPGAGIAIPKIGLVPGNFFLGQNQPNPFDRTTVIPYTIPEDCKVTIRVYNTYGQLVKTLLEDKRSSGSNTLTFDGSPLQAGVYMYTIVAQGRSRVYSATRMMVVVD